MNTITPEAKKELLELLASESTQHHMSEDGHSAFERAIEIVESFPTESAWISVEDRLPENGKDMFVITGIGGWVDIGMRQVGFHCDGSWFISVSDPYIVIYPTHWQPLPLPPSLPPVT